LQVDNIPHREEDTEEDTIFGNGLLFEVQYQPDIVQVCLPTIRSYKGAVGPALYSTMLGVRWTDLLSEYSTKERVISPTLFVLKVPFEVPHEMTPHQDDWWPSATPRGCCQLRMTPPRLPN
jgi:hypothetical protein